ncbi:hypothetical protein [Rivularia sp. UHCC 0363]|uniref:hypothetical protein n=1 Tax=Rivularia sp. UHCC 0363 TaxID=3110244 RepID=UPI002B21CA58|nr:hypothetical protein [Rivularia sp. UHCC 0363]MEA5595850.1 hypothetical protein [Rivularia sp. UHCC 0363]
MIQLLGEFLLGAILWIFAEIIFYGLCYFTGKLLIHLVTFGKYYPGDVIKKKELRKSQRAKGRKFTYIKDKRKYISFETVSLIGLIFWVIVVLISLAFISYSA